MNKLLFWALSTALLFAACNNTPPKEASTETKQTETAQTDPPKDEAKAPSVQAPTITSISKDDLPFDYTMGVGKDVTDAFKITDAQGTSYLVRGKRFLEGNHEMVVFYYKGEGEAVETLAAMVESMENCQFDLVDEHIKEVKISDLDQDGIVEVSCMFKLDCTSDVSPNKLFLAMFEGKDLYKMKGYTEVTEMGGTFKANPVLQDNESFLKAATDFWNKHKKEEY